VANNVQDTEMAEASEKVEPEAQSKSEMENESISVAPFVLPEEAQDAESNQASSHTRKNLSKPITPKNQKSDVKVKGKKSAHKMLGKRPRADSS